MSFVPMLTFAHTRGQRGWRKSTGEGEERRNQRIEANRTTVFKLHSDRTFDSWSCITRELLQYPHNDQDSTHCDMKLCSTTRLVF